MKVLYFDCFNGISGDMTVGALLDVGVDRGVFAQKLSDLGLDGYTHEISSVSKAGIAATDFKVVLTKDEHEHRNLSDILNIIENSALTANVKAMAASVFKRLAEAEAKVHAVTTEEIHFHEVGAVDSIVDIVASCICIDMLAPDEIRCSAVYDGNGTTTCAHGEIPVPVPAVAELFAGSGARLAQKECAYELVTPTGAAIILTLANKFTTLPDMAINATGYGAGKRDTGSPNVLRVFLGEVREDDTASDEVVVIETNIDDCTGEILGYTAERLFDAGALDVYYVSIFMKKGRPAYMLTVLCRETEMETMREIIFKETSSIGIRYFRAYRECMQRETMRMSTEYGIADVKVARFDSIVKSAPEYESAKQLAEESDVPLRKVYDDITKQTEETLNKW